jgi:SAM-dependent methyltransferase
VLCSLPGISVDTRTAEVDPQGQQPVAWTDAVVCPACGGAGPRAPEVRVHDHEYGVERVTVYASCSKCQTRFQKPMPGEALLSSFYPADYHSMARRGLLTRMRYGMRLRRLRGLAGGDGAILDYGCGDGSFLVYAASQMPGRGFFGYEIADRTSVQRLADGAVTIVRGSVAALLDELPPCQLITMNHVVEHLPDPLHVLRSLAARLVPGGTLEGQTPAAGSLEQRVFGLRWSGYHAPRHTVVFSATGLQSVLERAELAQVEVRGAFNPAGIAISLASLRQPVDGHGRVVRSGLSWLLWLGLASLLAPVDLLSGSPGIINFRAQKPAL